jgi:hypothetical protein
MRTIKNYSLGVWYQPDRLIPPVGVRVLCTNPNRDMWFDTINADQHWGSPLSCGLFAWQAIALPIDIFWEI